MDFDGSVHINEEELQKTDYAVVNYSNTPVEKIPHKRVWISVLDDSNGGLYGIEHIND